VILSTPPRAAPRNCQDLWIKIFPWRLGGYLAMKSLIWVMVLAVPVWRWPVMPSA
jgi:hypothetical protein